MPNSVHVSVHSSADVAVHEVDELVVHRLGLLLARADGGGGAVAEVVAHELLADAPERLVDGGDLGHDVGAVPVLLDHTLEAPDLPLDPAQALDVSLLALGVDADGLAAALVAHGA